MKADVFPATALPQLVIPPWVPDAIAQSVSARYTAEVDQAYRAALKESDWFEDGFLNDASDAYLDELIRDDVPLREHLADLVCGDLAEITDRYLPLTCDCRMEGVWRELSKRGSNGGFFHPVIGIDQDAAMLALFDAALACREKREATTTQRQIEQRRDHYLAKAGELRNDAITMLVRSPRDKSDERFRMLRDAAQAYEDLANEIYAANQPMALERKHDGQARGITLTIGNEFRSIFGKSMYRLTATIVSVVLGREIKFSTVRLWLETKA